MFDQVGLQKASKMNWPQVRAVVVSQAIRNAFEAFHGGMGDGRYGFLTDEQMKRLNICVRQTVYEALKNLDGFESDIRFQKRWGNRPDDKRTDQSTYCLFQLATFHEDYMELPGTADIKKAYKEFVDGYKGEK